MHESNESCAPERRHLADVVVRFAGDSGDGMQLAGGQFALASALQGNDLATFPDYPAEIRAPAGTIYGVSGFQVRFAEHEVRTPGDRPDVLVAMNPAALKASLPDMLPGALLVVNTGGFTRANLEKAGYAQNPLEDGSLEGYRVFPVDITRGALEAARPFGLGAKDAQRTKNMFALGLLLWLFDRPLQPVIEGIERRFGRKKPEIAQANVAVLRAGWAYGETAELPQGVEPACVPAARLEPGEYRALSGNEALAWGLTTAARQAGLPLVYGSYPITPASPLLHHLAALRTFGVTTVQAEDEIAAVGVALGASYGGALGVTGTSGPGLDLKAETIGLAVAAELPMVIVDVQRGGPSTGLPTKTEQSDLLQALWGRHGESPLPVLAARSPADCFWAAFEAVRVAIESMTPVVLLSDGAIANGAEPWRIPDLDDLPAVPGRGPVDPEGFSVMARDPKTLARPWAVPGTPGLEHRLGGLERDARTGVISYDPENHRRMTELRAEKVRRVADRLPEAALDEGEAPGELLLVGWGSTYGALRQATLQAIERGWKVAHLHLRWLNPLPRGLEALLRRFEHVVVAELNGGQLWRLLRSEFLVPAERLDKVAGQPLHVGEVFSAIETRLGGARGESSRTTAAGA